MIKRVRLALASLVVSAGVAHAADGLVTVPSSFTTTQTLDRLEAALKAGGATIVARVDHAAAASKADLQLRPTELLIFGNPKAGTPLMQASQTVGIDLPMKALAWQDAKGKVWLSYNDPAWIARRHRVASKVAKATAVLAAAMKAAALKATTAP